MRWGRGIKVTYRRNPVIDAIRAGIGRAASGVTPIRPENKRAWAEGELRDRRLDQFLREVKERRQQERNDHARAYGSPLGGYSKDRTWRGW
jgi:hypothetical protein